MDNIQKNTIASMLGFLAERLPEKRVSKLFALKLVYLADRYHLRKYGRTISEDEYYAMDYGPVATNTKRFVECLARPDAERIPFLSVSRVPQGYEMIAVVGPVDKSPLSRTDMEALCVALGEFAKHQDLVEFTHQFPEWRKQRNASGDGKRLRRKMDFEDFFLPAPRNAEYCDANEELVRLNLELLGETNNVWR